MKSNPGAEMGDATKKVPLVIRVLVLDPNPSDAERIIREIRRGGFEPNYVRVESEEEYLSKIESRLDVVVAHHAPPKVDALRVLQQTRERGLDVPIIVVSDAAGEDVAVESMRQGAADYLLKAKLGQLGPIVMRSLQGRSRLNEERRNRAQLLKANELLRAIRNVNELIATERDPAKLVAQTCSILLRIRGYRLVWIGQTGGSSQKVIVAASAGLGADFFNEVAFTWDDTPTGKGPTGTALKTRQTVTCDDMAADPDFVPWRKAALNRGYSSAIAAPIFHGERLYGVLNIYAHHPKAFEAEEVKLLTDVAKDMGAAFKGLEDLNVQERAQKEPRQAVERFRSVIESCLDVVAIVDSDLTIRYVSPAVETALGYKPDRLVGKSGFELMHPEDADNIRRRLKEVAQRTGASGAGELRFRHSDGTWRLLDCVGRNLLSDPSIAGFVVTARDATARRRADEARREGDERNRAIIENQRKTVAEELQRLRAELEKRIDEKTAEVRAANEALQKESAERQRIGEALKAAEEKRRLSESEVKRPDKGLQKTVADLERRVDERVAELRATKESLAKEAVERKRLEKSLREVQESQRSIVETERKRADKAQREADEKVRAALETERKRADKEIKEREEKLRAAIESDGKRGEKALRRDIAELERRVDERVMELRAAKESLEKEAAERKRLERSLREAEESQRANVEAERKRAEKSLRDAEEKYRSALEAERKRAAKETRPADDRFRSLVDKGADVAAVLEADLTIRYVSAAVERSLGYTPDKLAGKKVTDLLHPEDAEQTRRVLGEAGKTPGAVATVDVRIRHKDGSWRTWECAGRNLLADPAIAGLLLSCRDVTNRPAPARLLQAERQKQQAVFHAERTRAEEKLRQVRAELQKQLDKRSAELTAANESVRREAESKHQSELEVERRRAEKLLKETEENHQSSLRDETKRAQKELEKTAADLKREIEDRVKELHKAGDALQKEMSERQRLAEALSEAQERQRSLVEAERQKAEQALRELEEKHKAALEKARQRAMDEARKNDENYRAIIEEQRAQAQAALKEVEERARVNFESDRIRAAEGLQKAFVEMQTKIDDLTAKLNGANEALQTEVAKRESAEESLRQSEEKQRAALQGEQKAAEDTLSAMEQKYAADLGAQRKRLQDALQKAEEDAKAALEAERKRAGDSAEKTRAELTKQIEERIETQLAELQALGDSLQKERAERAQLEEALQESEAAHGAALDAERVRLEKALHDSEERTGEILESERKQAEMALQHSSAELATQVEEQIARLAETKEALEKEILQRKRVEQAMRELEAKHAAALEAEHARGEEMVRLAEQRLLARLEQERAQAGQSPPMVECQEHYAEEKERILAAGGIQKALAELEKRVEDLSAQLSSANESLQEQTAERRRLEAALREAEEEHTAALEAERRRRATELLESEQKNRSLLDIERRRAEEALRESREKERSVFEAERKRMEAALRDSEDKGAKLAASDRRSEDANGRLRSVMQASPVALFVLDPNGHVMLWSPAAEELSGYSEKEVLGRRMAVVPEHKMGEFRALHERVMQGPVFAGVEAKRQRKDGSEIDVSISTSPLRNSKGEIIGVLGILTDITERKRAERELRASFAKLRQSLESTLRAVAMTVETKDPRTAGHQRRVCKVACAVAQEMGLSEQQIEGLRLAADIHDIGKISVPAQILSKPGRLSSVEFDIVKTHASVGHEMLKTIEFPWPVAQAVLQHHERMNGSGYPQGLSHEDILLEARILAVADVVEAISSHRLYRPLLGIDKALEELETNKDKLYDAQVVDACIRLFRERKFRLD